MAKKYKDTFFRFYFSDKTRLLSLCNALTDENATNPDDIEIVSFDETFFSAMKNDIACMFHGRLLIMIEHQSTINPNMPLRFFLYLNKLFNSMFDGMLSKNLYGTTRFKIPRPEFFVLYNGSRSMAEFKELKLSDSFLEPTDSLELKVKVYNLNAPHNRELLMKSLPLEDYCVFFDKFAEYKRSGENDKAAFYEAYRFCMRTRNHMLDFLNEHEWELYDMLITEYNAEWDKAAQWEGGKAEGLAEGKAEGLAEGKAEGLAEGKAETMLTIAKNLLKTNLSIESIITATGCTEKQLLEIAKSI